MKDVGQKIAEVAALKHALPYLRLFQGRTFVVKLSGEAIPEAGDAAGRARLDAFLEQVEIVHRLGIRVVLVHGGGPQTTALATRLGLETTKVDGRRVTDGPTLEAAVMATAGTVNTTLLAACRRLELPAVGVSGIDAGLVAAHRRPPVLSHAGEPVDFGFVGDIDAIDPKVLERLLDAGFVPVVAPLAADEEGTVFNVNADTIAAEVARALGATKLLFALGVPGLLERADDPASLISLTDLAGLADLETRGIVSGGMLPKSRAVRRALEGGVARVHLVPFAARDALLVELFTNEGIGTMVVASTAALEPEPELVS
ncbi:MAG: acetylglutamate kinase [Thermoanaerobaculia bacterium]